MVRVIRLRNVCLLICTVLGFSAGAAGFSITTSGEGTAPMRTTFSASVQPGQTVRWNFGDGMGTTGAQVEHTYYRPGTYKVSVQTFSGGRLLSSGSLPLDVRSAGKQRAGLTLLLGHGSVTLSEEGSVRYVPGKPSFTVNGRSATGRAALRSGPVTVNVTAPGLGVTLTGQVRFTYQDAPSSAAFEAEVLRLTNRARAQGWNCKTQRVGGASKRALKRDVQLDRAALAQSLGMLNVDYFDHTSGLDGSTPFQRVRAAGAQPSAVAENIARGQASAQEVVDAWLRSPGHCVNIMGNFSLIGLSAVTGENGPFWTQVFTLP